MQSTKSPLLLPELRAVLLAHRPAVGQDRVFARMTTLVLGLVCAFSRHTLTQTLVALGLGELDWSAAYRLFRQPRLDYAELTRCFLRQTLRHVPGDQPYVVALDAVQVPRQSRTMPGTSWLHDPHSPPFKRGIHRAQRYSHLAWLTPRSILGYCRALPLRFLPAFPAKAVAGAAAPTTEATAGVAQVGWTRDELDAAEEAERWLLAVSDGQYGSKELWTGLPERTSLVSRCPKNRALFALPSAQPKRGRRRKYGERAPRPDAWLAERAGWTTTRLVVRGREVPCTYRVAGPYLVRGAADCPLFLLVVKGVDRVRHGQRRQRRPSFWLVNAKPAAGTDPDGGRWALPFPAAELLAWAWQRWEIEVTHRALKSGFGIGDSQCWSATATVLSVQWRVWVWSVLMLCGYRAWGLERGPIRPLGRWWAGSARWSFGQLWQGFRQELWQLEEFRPLWARTPTTWTEILDLVGTWGNATQGSRRI